MYVDHLSLLDFRSYAHLDLELGPGVVLFTGPNGVGKTNLAEALDFLSALGSHRVSQDAPLIRFGADRALVRARLRRGRQHTVLEAEINAQRSNRARVNRSAPRPARVLLGICRTVVFSPEDLSLVKGEPSGRRRFLDEALFVVRPVLAGVRADYDRALRQRTALLKSMRRRRADENIASTLAVWDEQLATAGARIMVERLELVRRLRPLVRNAYGQLADGPKAPTLRYRSEILPGGTDLLVSSADQEALAPSEQELKEQLAEALAEAREREVERGLTLVGPHRDDLLLDLGDAPARGYASHGETWSYALALRLALWQLYREESELDGDDPVLILDDVFAELDARRRSRLAEMVLDAEQVVITVAVPEDLPAALLSGDHEVRRFTVRPGSVHPIAAPSNEQEHSPGPPAEQPQ